MFKQEAIDYLRYVGGADTDSMMLYAENIMNACSLEWGDDAVGVVVRGLARAYEDGELRR